MTTSVVRFGLPCNQNKYVDKRDCGGLSCGWCFKVLIKGPEPHSHGICGPCSRKHFPELEAV